MLAVVSLGVPGGEGECVDVRRAPNRRGVRVEVPTGSRYVVLVSHGDKILVARLHTEHAAREGARLASRYSLACWARVVY